MYGNPNLNSHNLVFGDSTFSVTIMGVCPIDFEENLEEFRKISYSARFK